MPTRPPLALVLWVIVCAWLNASGWVLSWFGALNRAGYAVSFLLLGVLLWRTAPRCARIRFRAGQRFRRLLPVAWLILAGMVLFGALLYPPNNFDSLSYRIPRILHWLAAERWHWIPATYEILNTRATGFEFVCAPWVLFLGTDRWCVLINYAGFLLLPGLTFGVFARLGMTTKAAWRWMWVIPTGYCFILQCGGMGNDAYGAVCAMAMMYFALRARETRCWSDAAMAVIAAALTTGGKSGNLPLLLPAALALLPSLSVLWRRPAATAGVVAFGLLASLVPISIFNLQNAGTWFGSKEDYEYSTGGPLHIAVTGNAALIGAANLAPPILPNAASINATLTEWLPAWFRTGMERHFAMRSGGALFTEVQMEENAGLGFGVSLLVIFTLVVALFRRSDAVPRRRDPLVTAIRWSVWVALTVVLLKNFIYAVPRLILPYYALLLPAPLLAFRACHIVMQRWWCAAALASGAAAAVLLVVNPSRPLFPALTICDWLRERYPQSRAVERISTVYHTYRDRPDVLASVRELLPPDEKVIGIVSKADAETSLWKPFGSRWLKQVIEEDTAETIRAQGIRTVVVSERNPGLVFHEPVEAWLARVRGEIVATRIIRSFAGQAPWEWHVVRLAEDPADSR